MPGTRPFSATEVIAGTARAPWRVPLGSFAVPIRVDPGRFMPERLF